MPLPPLHLGGVNHQQSQLDDFCRGAAECPKMAVACVGEQVWFSGFRSTFPPLCFLSPSSVALSLLLPPSRMELGPPEIPSFYLYLLRYRPSISSLRDQGLETLGSGPGHI